MIANLIEVVTSCKAQLVGLSLLLFLVHSPVTAQEHRFPRHRNIVDVTKPPYMAKGDGVSDDTRAIQQALNENVGHHRVIYLPAGTYLISETLTWPKEYQGHQNWGFTFLAGEDRHKSILRLKQSTFTDPAKPKAMMWCGGFGSADWFHNYVEDLTFDVGVDNPGATALQFYSNNSGAVRNCTFMAAQGSGHTGLDLAHRDMNGPLLVKDCEVIGFRRGLATAHAVNSHVIDGLKLSEQSEVGLLNEGQALSVSRLVSMNAVPAVSTYGSLCLIDSSFAGQGKASQVPSLINFNGGRLYVRNLQTYGYSRAIADVAQTPDSGAAYRVLGDDKAGTLGPIIGEYCSQPPTRPFASREVPKPLPIKQPPPVVNEPSDAWAIVDDYGADPTAKNDSSAAIQAAIDSGARCIFFPGSYRVASTVIVRGNVVRLIGIGGQLNYGQHAVPTFRIGETKSPVLEVEHFSYIGGGIEVDSPSTFIARSVSDCNFTATAKSDGTEWFFEDVVTHNLSLKRKKLWARALNIENEGLHLSNSDSHVWILGYKTERGGTLAETVDGGITEILGGFSYTTTAGKLGPMFVNQNSIMSTWFSEICYNGDPFQILVREVRGEKVQEIKRGEGNTWPYVSTGGTK